MPCTKHCSICGKPFKGSFKDVMAKIRSHRKQEHPKAHKQSAKKALKTKGYDPIQKRKQLISKPKVLSHKDTKSDGLIRVLRRKKDYFPEFALYPHGHFEHQALKNAGLTQEEPRKWVLRTNRFNIFVYT